MTRGKLITLEGIEGAGKSTVLPVITDFCTQHSIDFLKTREPGGTLLAEQIRQILLQHHEEMMSAMTELLLIFAGRAQHVAQLIEPALNKGIWVISDRFVDASYAYQGGGRGIPMEDIQHLETMTLKGLKPDLTLFLDAPVELCLARARGRGDVDRIEAEKTEFFERARQVYLARAYQDPDRIKIIDVARDIAEVRATVLNLFAPFAVGFNCKI